MKYDHTGHLIIFNVPPRKFRFCGILVYMELKDINLRIQHKNFRKELKNFNSLRKRSEIPKIEEVFKSKRHVQFMKDLYQASWENHGDVKLTNKKLAEITGYSTRQVSRILKIAEDKGLIACLRVRGFNGGMHYNKYADKGYKTMARKRYWTWRCIRVWQTLANNHYVVLDSLGWQNDFRPKNDQVFEKARKRIPLKDRIKRSIEVQEAKFLKPAFKGKFDLIRLGYVWPTFFEELDMEYALRACAIDGDLDQKRAIDKHGYPLKFRRDRLRAVKREIEIGKLQENLTVLWYHKQVGLNYETNKPVLPICNYFKHS